MCLSTPIMCFKPHCVSSAITSGWPAVKLAHNQFKTSLTNTYLNSNFQNTITISIKFHYWIQQDL